MLHQIVQRYFYRERHAYFYKEVIFWGGGDSTKKEIKIQSRDKGKTGIFRKHIGIRGPSSSPEPLQLNGNFCCKTHTKQKSPYLEKHQEETTALPQEK